ncbi:MAG: FtsX-like permease family protein, partial [Chloroflexi bacterium]|nr:FtsX-like permease family protein [Chloroflexota bacterium]
MEELFGLSMNILMVVLLATFLTGIGVILWLALRNPIMVKLGLRNIPRRKGQTVLIVIGVMLSTLIVAAALGTGDTISYSIRSTALDGLGPIDEVIVYSRAAADDRFGSSSYITYERFEEIQARLAGLSIDGLVPQLAEVAPAINPRTSLSEGRMRVVGIDLTLTRGFGELTTLSGDEVRLEDLSDRQAYLNERAAEELVAVAGDEVRVVVDGAPTEFNVKEVVKKGGLAGVDPTLIVPLARAQAVFDRPGQVNLITVSNRGDARTGADLSDDVTEELRVIFSDKAVVSQIQELLNDEAFLLALEKQEESSSERLRTDLVDLRRELQSDGLSDKLIGLLGDNDVNDLIMELLEQEEFNHIEGEAVSLFADRTEFKVFDVKRRLLDDADEAGSETTSFFLIMSLFSIMVGVLLIFLIFVMLAAARRSEMGMARAIGAKRGHLVKMFVFEGTTYSVASAALGVLLGLAVSAVLVAAVNRFITAFDADFQLTRHFEVRSAIVAYCLGMIITLATIGFSAYRVSRLNIVVAIRGLPDTLLPSSEPPFSVRLIGILRALMQPVIFVVRAVRFLLHRRYASFLRNLGLMFLFLLPPVLIVGIIVALFRFSWPYLLRGWLTFLLGLLLSIANIANWERDSYFGAGVSMMVLGLGLMLWTVLKHTRLRADLRDRVAFTGIGVLLLIFWALPLDTFQSITGDLKGGFDVMFVSGIAMVMAAVFTVMYNADLLVKALSFVTGRVGKLRPVLVTAVAYPMSAKFRSGLTLAMFALVIFTLVVMSVLTEGFSASITDDLDTVVGGWDIEATVNFNTPIDDIHRAVGEKPKLRSQDFEAIGGLTMVGVGVRQVNANQQQWRDYAVRLADDAFLDAAQFKFKLIADGYGDSPETVWRALKGDPTLTVVEGIALPSRRDAEDDFRPLRFDNLFYDDEAMQPLGIEVRETRTGAVVSLTIIGVLDRIHETFDEFGGMLVSRAALDDAVPFPIPITTYQFRVADGADTDQIAKNLEASFLENGMEVDVLEDLWNEGVAAFRAFINIFLGFMGLGLVVGVAALGVVSTRAVVERRQQIGVLRAIGYRRRMVQLSFLLESSFIALFGTAIGVVLGLILSHNAISDIRAEEGNENIRYVIPWLKIGVIIAITYVFSLL